MNDLEQRVRESLRARANDVEATPHLWEEVQHRIERRSLQTVLLWAAGATAAAVIAAVVVLPNLTDDTPQEVVVDPAPSETATTDPSPDEPGPAPATGDATNIVVASDREINLLDMNGERLVNLATYPSAEFEGQILSVATSPTARDGVMGVAFTVAIEGNVELRLVRADNRPETVDETHRDWDGILPPQPVWSPDGSRLAWIDTTDGQTELKTATWQGGPRGGELGEPVSRGNVDGLDEFQLQEWAAPDRITAISDALQVRSLILRDGQLVDVQPLSAQDAAVVDFASTSEGNYTLAISAPDVPESQGDAESARAELIFQSAAGDDPVPLTLPDVFTQGTSNPYGMWLDAYGDTAVVGWGGLAWVIPPEGELYPLPGQVHAADLVELGGSPTTGGPTAAPTAEPTAEPTEPSTGAPLAGGAYVIVTASEMSLVATDGSRTVLMDWPADAEFKPARVEVRPGATVDDLVAVVLTAGEGETELGWVEVRDGEPVGYRRFPDTYQMSRPLDGASVTVPIWSPDGGYLAWVEEASDGSSTGKFGLRVVGWSNGPGTGDRASDNTSFELDGFSDYDDVVLDQWIWNSDSEGMLTFRYARGDERGYASSTVRRQPDGAITYDGDAQIDSGSVDQALTESANYLLVADATLVSIQQPGGQSSYDVPAGFRSDLVLDLPPAAGPWLDPAGDGALLFSADQRAWRVGLDGAMTELGTGIRDLDPVD